MKYIKLFENFINKEKKGYHISPVKNRENIKENGLVLESPKRYHLKGIYFWGFYKLSLWYALTEMRDTNTEFDIWEIDLSDFPEDEIVEDESIGIPYSFYTYTNIPPDKLKLKDIAKKGDGRVRMLDDILELENILMDIEDKLFDEI